ncbi:hypothetical protein HanIR_Chr17g0848981 [Helianthus annuus]|nr:hypothetical protein HanIR_Chr17g0848981 [Helianthus annuus]
MRVFAMRSACFVLKTLPIACYKSGSIIVASVKPPDHIHVQ